MAALVSGVNARSTRTIDVSTFMAYLFNTDKFTRDISSYLRFFILRVRTIFTYPFISLSSSLLYSAAARLPLLPIRNKGSRSGGYWSSSVVKANFTLSILCKFNASLCVNICGLSLNTDFSKHWMFSILRARGSHEKFMLYCMDSLEFMFLWSSWVSV